MIYLAKDHLNIFLLTCHQKPYEIQIRDKAGLCRSAKNADKLKMILWAYMQNCFIKLNIFYELRHKYIWSKLLYKSINWIYWFLTLIAKKKEERTCNMTKCERQQEQHINEIFWSFSLDRQLNVMIFYSINDQQIFLRWSMSRDERFRSAEKRNLYYPRH